MNVSGLSSGVSAIAAYGSHTCALTTGGGVKCWGFNSSGQLGDGSNFLRRTPVNVSGLSSGVSSIATGTNHTCALTNSGGLKCWGSSSDGQLGNGPFFGSYTPVDVSGLTSGVSAVAAGYWHTCALTSGGVQCWGGNVSGELGDGTTIQRRTPVSVSGLSSGVSAISGRGSFSDGDHTCALTTGGGVQCWGSHLRGQLGIGGRNYLVPGNVVTTDVIHLDGFENAP